MNEQPTSKTPPEQSQQLTWYRWPGVQVYGLEPGAPPPDYLTPRDVAPPQPAPQGAPPQQPQGNVPQQPPHHTVPHQTTAAPPAAPPPQTDSLAWMPPPLGPAITPDDRARQLGFIPPSDNDRNSNP